MGRQLVAADQPADRSRKLRNSTDNRAAQQTTLRARPRCIFRARGSSLRARYGIGNSLPILLNVARTCPFAYTHCSRLPPQTFAGITGRLECSTTAMQAKHNASQLSRMVALLLVAFAAVIPPALSQSWYLIPRTAIREQDIDCGQKDSSGNPVPYCRICGGLSSVTNACKSNPSCKAINMEKYGSCGYIKTSPAPSYYAEDYTTYLPGSAPAGKYTVTLRQSLPDQEVDCGKKDYKGNRIPRCQVCGGPVALAGACDANPQCVAFDMDDSGGCGYLKTGTASTYTEGTDSYVKATK